MNDQPIGMTEFMRVHNMYTIHEMIKPSELSNHEFKRLMQCTYRVTKSMGLQR